MTLLREMQLVRVSIREDERFLDAALLLLGEQISALAVVDGENKVVGLFTDDDLLRGLFPRYLDELHHTAFLVDDLQALHTRAQTAIGDSVARHMRDPVTVEIDAAPVHVVERFLHSPWGALAVVEEGLFVGMVGQLEFTEQLMRRLGLPAA
jgi:CBS domain-containing protein